MLFVLEQVILVHFCYMKKMILLQEQISMGISIGNMKKITLVKIILPTCTQLKEK